MYNHIQTNERKGEVFTGLNHCMYLLVKDTYFPDSESCQRLLTDQVNCVLSKHYHLTNRWPILIAALL